MERMKRAVSLLLCFVMVFGLLPMSTFAAETDWVAYEGESYYTLATSMEPDAAYVIARDGYEYALARSNNNSVTDTGVDITQSGSNYSISGVTDSMKWYIDASGHIYCTVNSTKYYLNVSKGSLSVGTSASSVWTVSEQSDTTARLSTRSGNKTYYFRYTSDAFSVTDSTNNANRRNMNLYRETVQPGGQARLNGELVQTISVGDGTTRDQILSKVTVEWDSNRDGVADTTIPMSRCTVTGTYDNEDADDYTLTVSYNGKTLGRVTVHVVERTAVSKVIFGNSHRYVRLNGVVDYSDIYLVLTYDDNSKETLDYNHLTFGSVDTSKLGENEVDIFYKGEKVDTVNVTVTDNPYAGLDTATEYPVYPAPGSVRMTKTAKEMDFENTGTVQIELTAAGISMKNGVDVILVTDLSNSMAWKLGTRDNASTHEETKLATLQTSVKSFADIFLANSADGTPTQNTVSLVTFGGFDKEHTKTGYSGSYADVTQTLLLGSNSASNVTTAINNIRLLVDSSYSGGYRLSFDGGKTYSGNYGNTNYDYAFMQAAEAITALKAQYLDVNKVAYDDSGRQIYVLFMTDGAPSNYNGVYYRGDVSGTDRPDVQATWVNAAGDTVQYTMGTGSGTFTNANWQNYLLETDLLWAEKVLKITNVVDIFNIGFDLTQGGFKYNQVVWTFDRLDEVLAGMVPGRTLFVEPADDDDALEKIYKDLAIKIRNAGTDAQVTDIIQEEFTLQLNAFGRKNSSGVIENPTSSEIEVRAYELWLPTDEGATMDLIGTRKRYNGNTLLTDPTAPGYTDGSYHYTTLEKVTFTYDTDGSVSGAYSTVVGEGLTNIYSESGNTYTIDAKYFTFHKDENAVETFKWKIGDITDDEIALSYFAYLENSMGEDNIGADERFYYTNEQAYLEYIDINGDYVNREYVRPQVYWGGASTAYEFYLVNADGKPCNYDGEEIPFANRIVIVDPEYDYLNLNIGENYYSREIIASKVLPAGYKLYDETASYEVITASGDMTGSINISTPAEGKVQTTIIVSATTPSYIQSHVAFGVYYNVRPDDADIILTPDRVVIDYGKVMHIDVSNGKTSEFDGNNKEYSVELVGFSKYFAGEDLTKRYSDTSYDNTFAYDDGFGTFRVVDGEKRIVSYTPDKLLEGIENVFCVLKLTEVGHDTNTFFMVEPLTVIPATIVYYETNFADGVFTYDSAWNISEDEIDSRASSDQVQSAVKIGTDLYGYDASYNDDRMFSDGESFKALGKGYDNNKKPLTYTLFSFSGTGFDLISRTGAAQGLIKVEVFSDDAMTEVVKTVSVLNKSESNLELYQIPVVSINDLEHNTYYVRIAVDAAYENKTGIPALNALNRGNEFYFDAIRIYDPVMKEEVANQAYIADGEANNDIYELRSLLLGTGDVPEGWLEPTYEDDEDGNEVEIPGVVFVDRNLDSVDLANYETIGPNNEVYLTNGQAIGFTLDLSEGFPASIDLGLKSANGTVATVFVEVFARNEAYTVGAEYDELAWYPFGEDEGLSISSCTVQFYDLISGAPEELYDYKYIDVIITNYDEESVLSVTDLKLGWGDRPATVSVVSTYNTLLNSVQVLTKGEEDTEVPEVNYDVVSASFTTTSVKKNKNATLTIVTSDDVETIEVRNSAGKKEKVTVKSVVEADGQKTWTVTFKINTTGNKTFTITGFGEDGTSGASVTASIKVNR